jgi:hypothetical protein
VRQLAAGQRRPDSAWRGATMDLMTSARCAACAAAGTAHTATRRIERMRGPGRPHGALLRLALLVGCAAAGLTGEKTLQRAPSGTARGGTVLVGLVDGSVHALDASTGRVWAKASTEAWIANAASHSQGKPCGASRRARRCCSRRSPGRRARRAGARPACGGAAHSPPLAAH